MLQNRTYFSADYFNTVVFETKLGQQYIIVDIVSNKISLSGLLEAHFGVYFQNGSDSTECDLSHSVRVETIVRTCERALNIVAQPQRNWNDGTRQ